MGNFKDNFSQQAGMYARYRPHYPAALYEFLSSLTKEHNTAWDCGTGNGQAAAGLAEFYDHVIATDPSKQQISNGLHHPRVTYRVEKAESTAIPSRSTDLLTVANAMHWFDLDLFYMEANRVLKPGGVIAAWCYGVPFIAPEVDKMVRHFHDHVIGSYWVWENKLVEQEYRTIHFPFEAIACPAFVSEKMMSADDFISYLGTWSATQKFINEHKYDPAEQLKKELSAVWKEGSKKVTWKLVLIAGRTGS